VKFFRWFVFVAAISLPLRAQDHTEEITKAEPSAHARAQAWFEQGQAAYSNGEYETAANLFRAVYEVTHAPAVLYDVAQAERLAGRCERALADYEEYVRVAPSDAPGDLTEKIAEMRRCAAPHSTAPPATAVPVAPKAPAQPGVKKDSSTHGRGTLRAVAYGSIAGAVACAALGTVFLIRANSYSARLDELNRPGARWEDRYASYESSMERNQDAALGFYIASGVLAAAATTILVFHWPTDVGASTASLSVLTLERGAGVSYRAGF
jgi:tetratricopeptide (TPR) repeat protein